MSTRILKDPVSGLSHAAGLLFALMGSAWLVLRARDGATLTTIAVYAASLVVLYAASSLYHLIVAGDRVSRALRLFDHVAIFLFVAGTSTPLLFRALDGRTRVTMLAAMWTLAAAGIAAKVLWRSAPRAVYTAMYVAMGWSVVAVGRALFSGLPLASFACVVGGGVVYTMGAAVYALKWPNPRPPSFGFHEVWHFFVLGGSALHFAAIAQLPS
jgi:hemolysin III